MKERPIIFSGEMVRAVLDGRKSQTRRIIKPQPDFVADGTPAICTEEDMRLGRLGRIIKCPYGKPDDRLWVRETWAAGKCADGLKPLELYAKFWLGTSGGMWYPADNSEPRHFISPKGRIRPSIHMPRWASRITLEVVDIRVERLQDISEVDAIAEGVDLGEHLETPDTIGPCHSYTEGFRRIWQSINGKESWGTNPWVWVVEFKKYNHGSKVSVNQRDRGPIDTKIK